jgi:DNA-binding winged helix-turn-helix (wHTH) protein
MHGKSNSKKKKYGLLVDLTKAFDCVKRDLLFDILWKRANNETEKHLVQLIYSLYRRSIMKIGDETIEANLGVP